MSQFLIIMIIIYCILWRFFELASCVYIPCEGFTYCHRCSRLPRGLSSANTIEKNTHDIPYGKYAVWSEMGFTFFMKSHMYF